MSENEGSAFGRLFAVFEMACDVLKTLIDWNKPEDVGWGAFLMEKFGGLVLLLILLAAAIGIIGVIIVRLKLELGGS